MKLRSVIIALPFFLVMTFALTPSFAFGVTCTATGSRPVTPEERQRAQTLGIPITGDCIDRITAQWLDARIDEDIAFFYANNRICQGKGAGLPTDFNVNNTDPDNWNRIRSSNGYVYFTSPTNTMNPGVLRCFRRFFERVEALGNPNVKPCVNAALRSLAHQRASCMARSSRNPNAPANSVVCGRGRGSGRFSCPNDLSWYARCPHVNGLAMDLGNNGGEVEAVLALARRFSGFSMVGVNDADPWHVEARGCADPNFRPSFNPQDTWTGQDSPGVRAPLGLGDLTRSALLGAGLGQSLGLGMPPPQPPLPPQPPPPPPLPTSQAVTGAFATPSTSAAPQSSAQTQTQTQTQANVSDQINVNTNINENTNESSGSTISVADRLRELAFGTTSATSGTNATSVPIVITGAQAGTIAYVEGQQPQQTATNTGGIPLAAQNTFTSGILSTQGFDASTLTPQETTVLRTLTTLRALLYTLLDYLRPFGLRNAIAPHDHLAD